MLQLPSGSDMVPTVITRGKWFPKNTSYLVSAGIDGVVGRVIDARLRNFFAQA